MLYVGGLRTGVGGGKKELMVIGGGIFAAGKGAASIGAALMCAGEIGATRSCAQPWKISVIETNQKARNSTPGHVNGDRLSQ